MWYKTGILQTDAAYEQIRCAAVAWVLNCCADFAANWPGFLLAGAQIVQIVHGRLCCCSCVCLQNTMLLKCKSLWLEGKLVPILPLNFSSMSDYLKGWQKKIVWCSKGGLTARSRWCTYYTSASLILFPIIYSNWYLELLFHFTCKLS